MATRDRRTDPALRACKAGIDKRRPTSAGGITDRVGAIAATAANVVVERSGDGALRIIVLRVTQARHTANPASSFRPHGDRFRHPAQREAEIPRVGLGMTVIPSEREGSPRCAVPRFLAFGPE
jgi:hypothetical protein